MIKGRFWLSDESWDYFETEAEKAGLFKTSRKVIEKRGYGFTLVEREVTKRGNRRAFIETEIVDFVEKRWWIAEKELREIWGSLDEKGKRRLIGLDWERKPRSLTLSDDCIIELAGWTIREKIPVRDDVLINGLAGVALEMWGRGWYESK